jgi:nanoRNase/pAp phosphatase (c-di-AMP/oligoRNAs hydrolase)
MVQSLHIPLKRLIPTLAAQYDRFAMVDSQPHHHEAFSGIDFSVVIDHHPVSKENPVHAEFTDIKTDYGANSTMLTEYLHNLKIRPGKRLATALLYGIKTDTSSFERIFSEKDVRAFQYLSKYGDQNLLRKIYRSEFHLEWLKYFSQAFYKMRILGQGLYVYMEEMDSSDILVILADFFLRVQGVSWTVIAGQVDDTVVAIFRGDGIRKDMGKLAGNLFGNMGNAGGHKTMARAEMPLEAFCNENPEHFLWDVLHKKATAPMPKPECEEGEQNRQGKEGGESDVT